MKQFILLTLILGLPVFFCTPNIVLAQEEKQGELEDFEEDYEDDDEDDSQDADNSDNNDTSRDDSVSLEDDNSLGAVCLRLFLATMGEVFNRFFNLWGGTPETAFGPYPDFPYEKKEGFMSTREDFRSYFFNTEFTYHYLNSNLRSFLFKWETQFADKSKLSFDLAVYQESIATSDGLRTDHLSVYGLRYGYAIYRSPQMILNLEGGLRGLGSHGGYELGLALQLFPKKPLIIETEVIAGLIEGDPLYIVESSAGLILGRFELLGGMRILKNQSGDLLDGFRLGLRVWY